MQEELGGGKLCVAAAVSDGAATGLATPEEALRLLEAFRAIASPKARSRVIDMAVAEAQDSVVSSSA